jgi:hypothetical protein
VGQDFFSIFFSGDYGGIETAVVNLTHIPGLRSVCLRRNQFLPAQRGKKRETRSERSGKMSERSDMKMQENAGKCRKIQENAGKFKKMQENSRKCRKIPLSLAIS